jgi:predicted permease
MNLRNELKQAFRSLFRKPGYTIVAVLMLGVGIAVNATIFNLANAVLLRPLPVKEPDSLARIYMKQDSRSVRRISYPDYKDFHSASEIFEDSLATTLVAVGIDSQNLNQQTLGEAVTPNYFSVLGIQAVPGRVFGSMEESYGSERTALISHRLWTNSFAEDPQTIGKRIRLNGDTFTIIGVAPASFVGTFAGTIIDVWVPLTQVQWIGREIQNDRSTPSVHMIGRLKKGVSREQANTAISSIALRLEQAYPHPESKRTGAELGSATLLHGNLRKGASIFLSLMLAISSLVLLTAVANVANLILISTAGKRREIAIRFALGAGKFSIFRQFVMENLLLTILAGIAGFVFSLWIATILPSLNPVPTVPIEFELGPDPRVFAFSMGLAVFMGVLLGLVPQLQFKTLNLLPSLQGEPGRATSGRETSMLRSSFVVFQIAASMVLLIGAALFLQSLRNARLMDAGFEPERGLAVDIDLKTARVQHEEGKIFYKSILEKLKTVPGVESAALGDLAPLDIATARSGVLIDGHQSAAGQPVFQLSSNFISAEYFKTLGIPLLSGQDFDSSIENSNRLVVIVNEAMAKKFWPDRIAIGQTFRLADGNRLLTIIGIARNVKYRTLGDDPEPHIYLPFAQHYQDSMSIFVRTSSDPARFIDIVQKEIRSLNPAVQGFFARTLTQHTSFTMLPARVAAWLTGIFGFIALILAVLGIYGTVGYSVAIRTREIGIRLALGAHPTQVLRWVVMKGMILAAFGLVTGLLLALAGTRLLSQFLYGISPTDVFTFVAVAMILGFTAILASYFPARRALHVDPAVALRYE